MAVSDSAGVNPVRSQRIWKDTVGRIHSGYTVSRRHGVHGVRHGILDDEPEFKDEMLTLKVRWISADSDSLSADSESFAIVKEPSWRRTVEWIGPAVLISSTDHTLTIEPLPRAPTG